MQRGGGIQWFQTAADVGRSHCFSSMAARLRVNCCSVALPKAQDTLSHALLPTSFPIHGRAHYFNNVSLKRSLFCRYRHSCLLGHASIKTQQLHAIMCDGSRLVGARITAHYRSLKGIKQRQATTNMAAKQDN